jgi:hypothetical protein
MAKPMIHPLRPGSRGLTGGRAGGAGPPAALARSERACGVEYNEAEAAVHAAVAVTAQSYGKRCQ